MTAPVMVCPSPSGGGPAPSPIDRALNAAAEVAEQLDLPLTMRQLAAIVHAAAPHLEIPVAADEPAPAVRMLRSLTAQGWPQTYLANRLGVQQPYVGRMLRQRRMRAETQASIARVFTDLHGVDPLEAGVHRNGVGQARALARSEGWRVLSDTELAGLYALMFDAA